MMFGPFWWLAPIEYGFHRSKSTQRPSREPDHTRVIVRLRGGAAGCAVARPIGVSAAAAAAPAMTARRPGRNSPLFCDIACFLQFPMLPVITPFPRSLRGAQRRSKLDREWVQVSTPHAEPCWIEL